MSWKVTLTSRAFHNDRLGPLCKKIAELTGKEKVLAHEHRRRGCGNCHQGRPPLGICCQKKCRIIQAEIIVC